MRRTTLTKMYKCNFWIFISYHRAVDHHWWDWLHCVTDTTLLPVNFLHSSPLSSLRGRASQQNIRDQHTHTTCVTLDYKYQLSFYPGKHHKHLTLIQCTVIQYKHKTVTCQIKGNNNVGTLSMWVCGMRNDINTFFCKRYMIEKIENRGDTGPGTTLTGGGTDLVNDDLPGTGIWGGL